MYIYIYVYNIRKSRQGQIRSKTRGQVRSKHGVRRSWQVWRMNSPAGVLHTVRGEVGHAARVLRARHVHLRQPYPALLGFDKVVMAGPATKLQTTFVLNDRFGRSTANMCARLAARHTLSSQPTASHLVDLSSLFKPALACSTSANLPPPARSRAALHVGRHKAHSNARCPAGLMLMERAHRERRLRRATP